MYSLPQSYNQTSKCKRCISSNAYHYYQLWENKLNTALLEAKEKGDSQETIDRIHINNPKIPLKYVKEHGVLLYENKELSDFKFAKNIK